MEANLRPRDQTRLILNTRHKGSRQHLDRWTACVSIHKTYIPVIEKKTFFCYNAQSQKDKVLRGSKGIRRAEGIRHMGRGKGTPLVAYKSLITTPIVVGKGSSGLLGRHTPFHLTHGLFLGHPFYWSGPQIILFQVRGRGMDIEPAKDVATTP